MKKAWRKICGLAAVIGLALVLGTAGSSDLGVIPFSQAMAQSAIGLAMFSGSLWLGGFLQ